MSVILRCLIAGLAAGAVVGILGAGGGMVLIPLLSPLFSSSKAIFPVSISIMLPICLVSLLFSVTDNRIVFSELRPFIIGSMVGGLTASAIREKISVIWLHRIFGFILLWGGFRCIIGSA